MKKSLIYSSIALLFASILGLGLWSPTMAQSFPEIIPLPDGFQPEGIALGNGPTAYVGSLADGSIYSADLGTGAGDILIPGSSGLLAVGLDFDKRSGYLFVAGGPTGDGRVYDARTGALVASLTLSGASSFINDVIVTQEAAFFTDSLLANIYKVPLTSRGAPLGTVETLYLGGDWEQIPSAFNANGIVATPDNRALIVVNSSTGSLYSVDPDAGSATEIDLGGDTVPNGDGLVLRGNILYVVQNQLNQIAVFTLSPDLAAATLTEVVTDSDLDTPSTAVHFGPWLYAVNARFGTPAGPNVSYDIVRVE